MNDQEKTQNTTEQGNGQVQQVNTPAQAEPQQNVQVTAPVQQEKPGFKDHCKKHKKGIIAAILGIGATTVSAIMAYKKGKAAGIMSVPPAQVAEPEDYSLNPNE